MAKVAVSKKSLGELTAQLKTLGFSVAPSHKMQLVVDGYTIAVSLNLDNAPLSQIDYGPQIKVWHKATSTFQQEESIVVLECVLRLLRKGYPPNSIQLEKTWKSGRGRSGRLDILIKDKKKGVFAMIECKTWGGEYEKERNKILDDGGQLFAYAIQERSAKHLVLYSSAISTTIDYQAESVDAAVLSGTSTEELHHSWDKTFTTSSILADSASCFSTAAVELRKNDLIELDDKSGQGLFHGFAEILRRHAVSDKSNAFNKIFNLFVCKIYDEDTRAGDDILDFQWKPGDDYDRLIKRLSVLYQKGIGDYLELPVEEAYFSPYSEFAFIDIYNKESYEANFRIVREIVELLQRYQIKYTQKHQFLGDFFEDLLNSGIKQEAGQFFTPTPLARFFIRSMPIDSLVAEAIKTKAQNVIPTVIDFACGAGHFLTEAIEEIEQIIKGVDYTTLVGRAQKHFIAIRDNYYWAKDYVYGIEKDYRLSKTTKIALFLNGDGDAVIMNADGLGSFSKDVSFRGLLHSDKPVTDLEQFDVLVSNPPFSITGFAKDIKHGKEDFSLFRHVSHKSSEIECVFIERAHQLLREGGLMGLILPLSILNNETSVYVAARRVLLVGFCVVGLVELRDKTFKPTNTTTVAVFAKKRAKSDIKDAAAQALRLVSSKSKQSLVEMSKKLDISPVNLAAAIKHDEKEFRAIEQKGTIEAVLKLSPDSFGALRHLLYAQARVLIGYSGEKKDQEHFLGYRFSKSRGQEGVEILRGASEQIDSRLYDPENPSNPEKVSFYLRNAFAGTPKVVDASLKHCLKEVPIDELLPHSREIVISNPSKFFTSRHLSLGSISPLGDFIDEYAQREISLAALRDSKELYYTSGLTYAKRTSEVPYVTEKRVLTASNIDIDTGRLDLEKKLIYLRNEFALPEDVQPQQNDIIISNASGSLKHLGKVAWVAEALPNYAVGGFLGILRFKDPQLGKAVYYRLMSARFRGHVAGLRGQNINNLDIDKVDSCRITVPKELAKFAAEAIKRERAG